MSQPPERLDPEFEKVVRASFARQGLMASIGAWLLEVTPGRALIELPYSMKVSQQHAAFHGAVIGAIADSAAGYAALSLMPPESEVVTVEYKINFLKPAIGAVLVAEGEVVRAGRTLTIAKASVSCREAGAETGAVVALLQATMMRVSG